LLPKKKSAQGGSVSYEGFDVVAFPKEAAESIRKNKADLRDDVDRDSALVRPTGRDGVAQSGLSKVMDHSDGNNRLAKIAKVLARLLRLCLPGLQDSVYAACDQEISRYLARPTSGRGTAEDTARGPQS